MTLMYLFQRKCFFSFFLVFPFPSSFKANCSTANSLFSHLREPGLIFALAIKMEEETCVVSSLVLSGCVLLARAPCPQALLPQVPETFEPSAFALRERNAHQPSRRCRTSSPRPRASSTFFCPPLSPHVWSRSDLIHCMCIRIPRNRVSRPRFPG